MEKGGRGRRLAFFSLLSLLFDVKGGRGQRKPKKSLLSITFVILHVALEEKTRGKSLL